MKTSLACLFAYILLLSISTKAQPSYDQMVRDSYYLIKSASVADTVHVVKASNIKTIQAAEKVFGRNYTHKRVFAETENIYLNKMEFKDGLTFYLPENPRLENGFHITSESYSLVLISGVRICVGMDGKAFQKIFPSSYEQKRIIRRMKGKIGNIMVTVIFSRCIAGQIQIEDAQIIFIFDDKTNKLEEFYTYSPV